MPQRAPLLGGAPWSASSSEERNAGGAGSRKIARGGGGLGRRETGNTMRRRPLSREDIEETRSECEEMRSE
jgi:hypothetical protein